MKKIQVTIYPINIEITKEAVKALDGKIVTSDNLTLDPKMITVEFNNLIDLYHFGRTEKMEEMFYNETYKSS